MTNWTRYEVLQEDGTVVYHIAPSTPEGQLLAPHNLRPDCGCKPLVGLHNETGRRAFMHNDPRRSMH